MTRAAGNARLEDDEFRLLRELLGAYSGLRFGPEARYGVERRLRERLVALGLRTFGEYYEHLRFRDPNRAELDEALDLVTVNETYFFREDYQLKALRSEVVPAFFAAGRERVTVWSAGCSTGEEVYSIAITLREAGLGGRVKIFGSDISRRCIAAARRGVYGAASFRTTPPDLKRKYFAEAPGGLRVTDEVRAMCQFGHLNLLDQGRAALVGRVDVVFCRNVLIYFDDASRRRVIDMFYERLLPGGYLLLGHSESLLNLSTAFELVHLREDLAYRKPHSTSRFGTPPERLRRRSSAPPPGGVPDE